MAKFQKGQSGNPKGRPPKERTLTRMLENAGKQLRVLTGDEKVTAQRAMVNRIWEGVTTGVIRFPDLPDGTPNFIALDAADWTRLAKLLYDQIDGPPKAEMDVTSGGQPINIVIAQGLEASAPPAFDTDEPEDGD